MAKSTINLLQELSIKQGFIPTYNFVDEKIDATSIQFTCNVRCKEFNANGTGTSKKEAKHNAAKEMLSLLIKNNQISLAVDTSSSSVANVLQSSAKVCEMSPSKSTTDLNYIGLLQEFCQQQRISPKDILYEVICEDGPPHIKTFTIEVSVESLRERAVAQCKKAAKQEAARKLLLRLNPNIANSNIVNLNTANQNTDKTNIRLDPNLINIQHNKEMLENSIRKIDTRILECMTMKETLPIRELSEEAKSLYLEPTDRKHKMFNTSSSSVANVLQSPAEVCEMSPSKSTTDLNYIGLLQEFCQQQKTSTNDILYEIVCEDGPPHRKTFTIEVSVGSLRERAVAQCKKAAKQEAARKLLLRLNPNIANSNIVNLNTANQDTDKTNIRLDPKSINIHHNKEMLENSIRKIDTRILECVTMKETLPKRELSEEAKSLYLEPTDRKHKMFNTSSSSVANVLQSPAKVCEMSPSKSTTDLNYIGLLQEFCQQQKTSTNDILYEVVCEDGPPHRKTFTIEISVGSLRERAVAQCKKAAKQEAARKLLLRLNPNIANSNIVNLNTANQNTDKTNIRLDPNLINIQHNKEMLENSIRKIDTRILECVTMKETLPIRELSEEAKSLYLEPTDRKHKMFNTSSSSVANVLQSPAEVCEMSPSKSTTDLNYIGLLQEFCQQQKTSTNDILYEVVCEDGPPHRKTFTIEVSMGSLREKAVAQCKKVAKQEAARKLLLHLNPNIANSNIVNVNAANQDIAKANILDPNSINIHNKKMLENSIRELGTIILECVTMKETLPIAELSKKAKSLYLEHRKQNEFSETNSFVIKNLHTLFEVNYSSKIPYSMKEKMRSIRDRHIDQMDLMREIRQDIESSLKAEIQISMCSVHSETKNHVVFIRLLSHPHITQIGQGETRVIAESRATYNLVSTILTLLNI